MRTHAAGEPPPAPTTASTANPTSNSGDTVADANEARIIELLLQNYPEAAPATGPGTEGGAPEVLIGIGDDATLLRFRDGRVLSSVDSLVEGQDFLREWPCGYRTTGEDAGFKSTAQNVSDINAMGGHALCGLVALSLPHDVPLEWVRGYARGVSAAVRELGATGFMIVGGDLSRAGEITATMTVLGAPGATVLTRAGARVGDRVVVAGRELGRADVALGLLNSTAPQDRVAKWGQLERSVAAAMFRPLPPLTAGPAASGQLTSLMDVSDGLVRDASRIAAASGVGVRLDPLAIDAEAEGLRGWAGRHAKDAQRSVLLGGEDHLLLGTSPGNAPVPEGFRELGRIVQGRGVALGERALDVAQGFDHFREGKPS